MNIRDKIVESTVEIFTSMVMMEITVSDKSSPEVDRLENTITGVIGLAGKYKGILVIHFPYNVAFTITSNFLGIDVEEMNEDVEDAIGEIANMLGGSIKSVLSDNGKDIDLSLPSTVFGKEYGFQTIKNAEKTVISFTSDPGSFIVELQLEK